MTGSDTSSEEIERFRVLAEALLEDDRGVDLSQIRDRLRLTPAERLQRMVDEVETLRSLVESAERNR